MALIERAELHRKLGQIPNYHDDEHEAYVSLREVRAVIDQVPEVEAEPVIHAIWHYYVNDEGKARWRCNNCGKLCRRDPHDKVRCSGCGAHMRKEA